MQGSSFFFSLFPTPGGGGGSEGSVVMDWHHVECHPNGTGDLEVTQKVKVIDDNSNSINNIQNR